MSQVKPTILVTGGAGYIGTHVVLALQRAGYGVIVLDNVEYGHRELMEDVLQAELVVGFPSTQTSVKLSARLGSGINGVIDNAK